jgi:hypothetical protein
VTHDHPDDALARPATGAPADAVVDVTVNGSRRTGPVSRRAAMQWVMGAVAASALPNKLRGQTTGAPPMRQSSKEEGRAIVSQELAAKQPDPTGAGYGTDPKLVKDYKPGDVWPLTFNEPQKKTAAALADTIIPKDDLGPAASEVGVVEMIDEWVSAPYPQQKSDRPVILDGLSLLENESLDRFNQRFESLSAGRRSAICDDICFVEKAKPEHKKLAQFFDKFRDLAASAYYATPPGWQAIGYVGNTPLVEFTGPPPEVLERLGLR